MRFSSLVLLLLLIGSGYIIYRLVISNYNVYKSGVFLNRSNKNNTLNDSKTEYKTDNDLSDFNVDSISNDGYFSITESVPDILNSENIIYFRYFNTIISSNRNKFCHYAAFTFKAYSQANHEDFPRLNLNIPFTNFRDCTSVLVWSNKDLYQLYLLLYNNFVKDNYPNYLEYKIRMAKRVQLRQYFNIIQDYPQDLDINVLQKREVFLKLLEDDDFLKAFCFFSKYFAILYNSKDRGEGSEKIGYSLDCDNKQYDDDTIYNDYKKSFELIHKGGGDYELLKEKLMFD